MSILFEILLATLFSALLSPQPEVKETGSEKVKTEQVSSGPTTACKTVEKV